MKKTIQIVFVFLFCLNFTYEVSAQILSVPRVIQEQDQWCWAASTKSVLNYFNDTVSQCSIADYTRVVSTWHNFGNSPCCSDATSGCNYWNYDWGTSGSIEDILHHFGNISVKDTADLSLQDVISQFRNGHPFIFRWGWYSGGGHFLVAHGVSGINVSYMDPWFGNGYEIASYNWIENDGVTHQWTSTQKVLSSCAPPAQPATISGSSTVCFNSIQTHSITPVSGAISYTWTLPTGWKGTSATTSIIDTTGTSGGLITVVANNVCGSSAKQTLNTLIPTTPAQPGLISGSNNACQNSIQKYFVAPVSGATNYIWTLPSGWLGTSTADSIFATVGNISDTISVRTSNNCVASTPRLLPVNVKTPPSPPTAIHGNNNICKNSSQLFSIDSVQGATSYTWALPLGWTGSSTSTLITTRAGSSTGNIFVKANNSCGSSLFDSLPINVKIVNSTVTVSGNTLSAIATSATFQWLTCPAMQIINSATSQNYSPSKNGSYAVVVNQNNCTDTSICYTLSHVGISNLSSDQNVIVYPNPTVGLLNIGYSGLSDNTIRLVLSNTIGQTLIEKEVKLPTKSSQTQIDINDLPNGIYFLTINSSEINQVFKIQKLK